MSDGDDLLAGMAEPPSALDAAIGEASIWIGDGIEGVGEGRTDDGSPCLVVFVSALDQATRDRVPATMHGYPVVLSATDSFVAETAPEPDDDE
ncbi:MAG: hypothetical protein AAFO29_10430 [Actinomycetota bacterium]